MILCLTHKFRASHKILCPTQKPVSYTKPCGEGIYPRWVAKRPLLLMSKKSGTALQSIGDKSPHHKLCVPPSILMQHPGTVLIQTTANTVPARLQRRRIIAPIRRLTISRKTTGRGQPTRPRTSTQNRHNSGNQQHFGNIQAHGTIPLGMKNDDLVPTS